MGTGMSNDTEQSVKASVATPSITEATGRQERYATGGDIGATRDYRRRSHSENIRIRQQEFQQD